jgi:salicylate hydroxylase
VLKAPAQTDLRVSEVWSESASLNLYRPILEGLGSQYVPLWRYRLASTDEASRARKIFSMGKQAVATCSVAYEALEQWTNDTNNVILVGHAAHPLTVRMGFVLFDPTWFAHPLLQPSGSQHTAVAIEDAAALGALFSGLSSRNQLPALLSAFEDVRLPRTTDLAFSERSMVDFICLPPGPARTARDAGFRRAAMARVDDWEDAPDEIIAEGWSGYVVQWAYDAEEAVEDWWAKWGTMFEHAGGRRGSEISVKLEVCETVKDGWTI